MATHALFLKRCSQRTPATVTLCIIGILGGVAGLAPPRACCARLSRPLPCIGRERCAPQCASSNRYLALVTGCARPLMHEPHSTPKAARSWIANVAEGGGALMTDRALGPPPRSAARVE